MKPLTHFILIFCTGLFVGCAASIPPEELINARQVCSHASASPATQRLPAELSRARAALALAEKAFSDNPTSLRTRALAIIAYREAKRVEALAATASGIAVTVNANTDLQPIEVKNDKEK
jgi:hypothetical protein